jgi:hypothetical protein
MSFLLKGEMKEKEGERKKKRASGGGEGKDLKYSNPAPCVVPDQSQIIPLAEMKNFPLLFRFWNKLHLCTFHSMP